MQYVIFKCLTCHSPGIHGHHTAMNVPHQALKHAHLKVLDLNRDLVGAGSHRLGAGFLSAQSLLDGLQSPLDSRCFFSHSGCRLLAS